MRNRILILAPLLFLASSLRAFAVGGPTVADIPAQVNGTTYTLTIYTDPGATVTVLGGPADIAPVTDGQNGDVKDGVVKVTVGLAPNTTNVYSVSSSLNGSSSSTTVSLKQVSSASGTVPAAPVLNKIPDFVTSAQYILTGTAEPNDNIYARTTDGKTANTTSSDANGHFSLTLSLVAEATNRFNISAENVSGEGPAVQAVIHQTNTLPAPETPAAPKLETSAQIFFNDLTGHWAADYINQLYQSGVVSGKSAGIFEPDGLITRAELTKIAILAFGHSVNTTVDHHPFGDVPANSWFAPYVEEAKRLGFVAGYASGGFGPNDFVNRAAALKILLGSAGIDVTGSTTTFPDIPKDAWFAPYVGFAQVKNLIAGYSNGNFGPNDPMTRAQVAKVVVKLLDYKKTLQ